DDGGRRQGDGGKAGLHPQRQAHHLRSERRANNGFRYGIVGDLYKVTPMLIEAIRAALIK
ncbi:hypothetical protein, partial [Pseudoflavonifractor phocaeensis]|uniref:hypothetical protein n=1 Tax=Pseudoflavonifractor phocaeensis TaxID=1870988 RepID=UPI00195C0E54